MNELRRIAVTGGAGLLGRACVQRFLDAGLEVASIDRVRTPDERAQSVLIDLTDLGQTMEAFSRVDALYERIDAVVHLAAIPAYGITTSSRTLQNNLLSTHHVFLAASTLGIDKVVWASSETVLGVPFDLPPAGVPVTEDLETVPQSTYAMVKTLEEQMAGTFARWNPSMSFVGLRLSNVIDPSNYGSFPSFSDDLGARRFNLWSYVDARDAAEAALLALRYPQRGREVFIIAADDTVMTQPTAELMAEVFPHVPLTRELAGHESLLSTQKAKDLLGYRPMHSWRDPAALENQPTEDAR